MAIRASADDLRDAALERIAAARHLYNTSSEAEGSGHFSAAIYLAGVAVECMLRAYRVRTDPQFDSRHDLVDLLRTSGLAEVVPESRRPELTAAVGQIWARWKNEYRYASDRRVLADLRSRELTRGVKGDPLKENARVVIDSAYELINVGVKRWKSD